MPSESVFTTVNLEGSELIVLAEEWGSNDARRAFAYGDETFELVRYVTRFQKMIPYQKRIYHVPEYNEETEKWIIWEIETNEMGAIQDSIKLPGYNKKIWRRIIDMDPNYLDEISDRLVAEQNRKMIGESFGNIMLYMKGIRSAEITSKRELLALEKLLANKKKKPKKKIKKEVPIKDVKVAKRKIITKGYKTGFNIKHKEKKNK